MAPDFCVAQRISPSIGARRCPWLPKCSALNATRRRATRRDTRTGANCARHEVRPVTPDGKHRSAGSDCPSTSRHGVNECRRYACRCMQRGSSRSHTDDLSPSNYDRSDAGLSPRTGASAGVRVRENRGLTSGINTWRHLHRYQPQYLMEYRDRYMCVYRGHSTGRHRYPRRAAGAGMHVPVDMNSSAAQCQQTRTARCCCLDERRTCNTIVTGTCRRVVLGPRVDAAHLIVDGTRRPVGLAIYVHTPCAAADRARSTAVAYVGRDAASNTYAPMCFTTGLHARNDTCPLTCESIAMTTAQATHPAALPRIGCKTAWQTSKRMQ